MGDEFHGLNDYDDYDDENNHCEGCGRSDYNDGQCPLCCGHGYAPGSEECDFCEYSDVCAKYATKF